MIVKRTGRDTKGITALMRGYFFSCSMTAFACAASCYVGSTAITFSSILIVASLSPLFSDTRAGLKIGLPHDGCMYAAFWNAFAASLAWHLANLTSPRLEQTSR